MHQHPFYRHKPCRCINFRCGRRLRPWTRPLPRTSITELLNHKAHHLLAIILHILQMRGAVERFATAECHHVTEWISGIAVRPNPRAQGPNADLDIAVFAVLAGDRKDSLLILSSLGPY
ncbi:hypothetical protein P170DRAFT_262557 [Aspergillus steynii IBT 23096]|uniref:Uncharacterized protein n=1 Tax=Aspergillus steynii IBT 23096 TaxID=1392250 RepID=A0A2I2FZY9_9EURO|nr:uncharacterized protein P170DRAFT_262557 [Aspergillus steynii IBT 23096]PLB46189.1 hypothetical protein P170DRAFT_262557 [Aspergillus steynii IBT 23096]